MFVWSASDAQVSTKAHHLARQWQPLPSHGVGMLITRCAVLACLLACNGPRPPESPSDSRVARGETDPTSDKVLSTRPAPDAGGLDGWEAVERDIAAADARPEVCAKLILDGERVLVCCPRGLSFNLESRRCVQPPPSSIDPAESPPPDFTVKLKELEACTQGSWKQSGAKTHGRCEDGKRFFESSGFYTGGADFYRGEHRAGSLSWSDVGPEHYEGDTGCKVVERVGLCGTPLSFFSRTVYPASPSTVRGSSSGPGGGD